MSNVDERLAAVDQEKLADAVHILQAEMEVQWGQEDVIHKAQKEIEKSHERFDRKTHHLAKDLGISEDDLFLEWNHKSDLRLEQTERRELGLVGGHH